MIVTNGSRFFSVAVLRGGTGDAGNSDVCRKGMDEEAANPSKKVGDKLRDRCLPPAL